MTGPGFPAPPGHPDLETLADLDAGVLDRATSSRLRAHLVNCSRCQTELAGLGDIRAMLRDLPTPPMPATVEERIFAALASERQGWTSHPPVSNLAETRRRRRYGLIGLAAAGLVLVAGTTVVLSLPGGSPQPGHAPLADQNTSQPAPIPANPPSFTRDTLTNAPVLADILNGRGGGLRPQSSTSTSMLAGSMADAQQRQSCETGIDAAVPGITGAATAVEYIRFEGTRGYLFVYLNADQRRTVVVGTDCSSAGVHVLYTGTAR